MKGSCVIPALLFLLLTGCRPSRQISGLAKHVLQDSSLRSAHVGISVYDAGTGRYLYRYQDDNFFVPASNVKIATCYVAMKHLGDSLVGLRYGIPEKKGAGEALIIRPAGDPTFLHPDFREQPVYNFLKQQLTELKLPGYFFVDTVRVMRWGNGWSWNDYEATYMAERSPMPVLGNTIFIRLRDSSTRNIPAPDSYGKKTMSLFTTGSGYFDSLVNSSTLMVPPQDLQAAVPAISLSREIDRNAFTVAKSRSLFRSQAMPFVTNEGFTAMEVLSDTLKVFLQPVTPAASANNYTGIDNNTVLQVARWFTIRSHPTDSLLKPMMHRSDNFFAEQSLLMVSNEMLGVMNEARLIDTLLRSALSDLPHRPHWVDGSGLSRYNLFTPRDFIVILNKIRTEAGMERVKEIFPTGNEGTLAGLYKSDSGYIYAKTGTLSGVVAFSGFLYTQKNRLLVFSILVNNHQASAAQVRRKIEQFVGELRKKF